MRQVVHSLNPALTILIEDNDGLVAKLLALAYYLQNFSYLLKIYKLSLVVICNLMIFF